MSELHKKTSGNSLVVSVFNGMKGLDDLQCEWKKITDTCASISFYHRYEWYHAYLAHLEPTSDNVFFFLVINEKNHNPVAIVPLKRQCEMLYGLRVHLWVTPRTSEMDLYDVITINESWINPIFHAVVDKLNSIKEFHFDAIVLDRVLENGLIWNLANDVSFNRKIVDKVTYSKYLVCGEGEDISEAYGSSKFRRNLRRLEKRLNTFGEINYQYVRDEKELFNAYRQFLDVESSGWKGGGGSKTAIKLNERAKAFYSELLENFGRLNRSRINLLRLNGKAVAAQYCLVDDDRINLLKIGHDPQYQDCSPGFQLIKQVFEDDCGEGKCSKLSFVTGAEWNDIFKPKVLDVVDIQIFGSTIKGQFLFVAKKIKRAFKK